MAIKKSSLSGFTNRSVAYVPATATVTTGIATPYRANVAVVGAGGGAAQLNNGGGGGGGGGQFVYQSTAFLLNEVYTISIGAGGSKDTSATSGGNATRGGISTLTGNNYTLTAIGGGAGMAGQFAILPSMVGSSSGGTSYLTPPNGLTGSGYKGGSGATASNAGGGGGGAGADGQTGGYGAGTEGGSGGIGVQSSILGTSYYWCGGGGGGGKTSSATGGNGGAGGGGGGTGLTPGSGGSGVNAGSSGGGGGGNGGTSTGGGGGGGGAASATGNGGSGTVIFQFPSSAVVEATGTYTTYTSGGFTSYLWTSSGTIKFIS